MAKTSLILGGARSGKSAIAEKITLSHSLMPIYLASAQALDEEMANRVARHQNARQGHGWTTIEEPRAVAQIISNAPADQAILFDCATLWLTNHWMDGADLAALTEALTEAITRASAPITVVSNELGQGNISVDAATRHFNDAHGVMNQALAQVCEHVAFVTAGLSMTLKGTDPLGAAS